MTKHTFSAYSTAQKAWIQGALNADVYAPSDCRDLAYDLAIQIAKGFSRREAGDIVRYSSNRNPRGWRVMRADFCQ